MGQLHGATRHRLMVYKDSGGTLYPSDTDDRQRELTASGNELWELTTDGADAVTIVTAAAGGGSNEYKVTFILQYDGSQLTTRLVYKADIIGTATALTNLQL